MGSGMNAPARFGGYRDRYDASLAVMCPLPENEDARRLRRRLLTARDLATRALSAVGGEYCAESLSIARVLLAVSSTYCFRPCDTQTLGDAADLCLKLLRCTSALDRLEGDDEPAD
jgi:hypothetical protein